MKRSKLPKSRAVQHDGTMLGAILADIGRAEPFGQDEIDLQRAALPVAPDCVGQHELQLWAIESAFAGVELEFGSGGRVADLSAASDLSQTSSLPARFSGRSENLTAKFSNPRSR